jgi:branched-subunit amino acid transport protein
VSAAWATIAGLTAGTVAIKAAGPLVLGGRPLPRPLAAVVGSLAPALLAALVVVETLGTTGGGLTVDARLAGVAAAGAALALRAPLGVVILVAAAVTAGLRALT